MVASAGAVAALAACGRPFTFADAAIVAAGEDPPPEVSIRLAGLASRQGAANAACGLGLAGLALAGILGGAAGGPARSIRSAVAPPLIGLALGGIAGGVGAAAFGMQRVGAQDLAAASAIQAAIWGLLGLAVGLALASRGPRGLVVRLAGRGLVGGLLWGASHPPLAAAVDPRAHVERAIPEGIAAKALWVAPGAAIALATAAGRGGAGGGARC